MRINFGAIAIFAKRAVQISAYLMLALNTIKIAGLDLGGWIWFGAGIILLIYVILDVLVIFPQEMDYSVRRNKTLMDGLNRWRRTQDD